MKCKKKFTRCLFLSVAVGKEDQGKHGDVRWDEAGAGGKQWKEMKALAQNRVRWRSFLVFIFQQRLLF